MSIIEQMREPMQQYNYNWAKLQAALDEATKDYVPYIVPLGNGLYQVNGGDGFSYITGIDGVIAADKALRKAIEEHGTE